MGLGNKFLLNLGLLVKQQLYQFFWGCTGTVNLILPSSTNQMTIMFCSTNRSNFILPSGIKTINFILPSSTKTINFILPASPETINFILPTGAK